MKIILSIILVLILGGFVMAEDKKILEGVPFNGTTRPELQENFHFCGSMRAIMEFLGENPKGDLAWHSGIQNLEDEVKASPNFISPDITSPKYNFIWFAGVTGALFFDVFDTKEWSWMESITGDVRSYKANDEAVKYAFKTIGYDCEIINDKGDKKLKMEKIKKSIDKGYPVIAYGLVGPPTANIIVGYDGDKLVGRSPFQGDEKDLKLSEPDGYFIKRVDLNSIEKLVFFGDKVNRPTDREIAVEAVNTMVKMADLPDENGLTFGSHAYKAWAAMLLDDSKFANADKAYLDKVVDVHMGQKVIVMTGFCYLGYFLKKMSEYVPEYEEDFNELIDLANTGNEVLGEFWELEPDFGFDSSNLKDREYREKLARIIFEGEAIYSKVAKKSEILSAKMKNIP